MEDQKVTFETAKLALELGFDINCGLAYDDLGREVNWTTKMFYCWKPTQSLLQRWIRETFKIHIEIEQRYDFAGCYIPTIKHKDYKKEEDGDFEFYIAYDTYEKCLESSLQDVLKQLKINNYHA